MRACAAGAYRHLLPDGSVVDAVEYTPLCQRIQSGDPTSTPLHVLVKMRSGMDGAAEEASYANGSCLAVKQPKS